ncbi:putative B3 domain-containing protein REM15 [Coffea eugenioides]|uniref:putative B3 domain-containing protein REM15 n=1 Tax=Coffea eugenioides TaxID=49369 RepID=UPI000F610A4D|nr:putative B3 domain-containing protein REM15 [Coffea eugenioides]
MRVSPEKPHFFKPILPGFKNGLKIPVSFSKYLCGERSNYMLLRRGAREWRVKMSGQSLEEGWRKFAVENNLEVGDFVVFKHEGNMVFDVRVFDPSHCEREYPWIHDVTSDEPKEEDIPSSKKFKSAGEAIGLRRNKARTRLTAKSGISIDSEGNSEENEESTPTSRKASSDDDEEPNKPYFVSSIKPYCIKNSILHIPLGFARANNLRNRSCEVILRDPQQKSWQVEMVPKASHVCFRRGWSAFFKANGLKLGDTFKIELVENGKIPVLDFVPCLTSSNKEPHLKRPTPPQPRPFSTVKPKGKCLDKKLEASPESNNDHPNSFVSTIKAYSIKYSILHLPMKFARSTGLIKLNGEMILRDERKRQWSVRLQQKGKHVLISSGWSKFRTSNGLKEGDTYKFELIKKGQRPLVNFYCKYCF